MQLLKKIAARLPSRWQNELKRIHFARQIKKGVFVPDEPEDQILDQLIHHGDWVIDIGANVGHYTKIFSDLVGSDGRVIAFEPVPSTFSILSSNVQLYNHSNVTLINSAVSNKLNIVGMCIPKLPTGLDNYYEAHISTDSNRALSVLTLSLDLLCITQQISLVKIDAEGHESFVLSGMKKLIKRWHPILIVETRSNETIAELEAFGYAPKRLNNSPNVLCMRN